MRLYVSVLVWHSNLILLPLFQILRVSCLYLRYCLTLSWLCLFSMTCAISLWAKIKSCHTYQLCWRYVFCCVWLTFSQHHYYIGVLSISTRIQLTTSAIHGARHILSTSLTSRIEVDSIGISKIESKQSIQLTTATTTAIALITIMSRNETYVQWI